MKKISYISIFAIFALFSCSKEQVLQPANNNVETFSPSMIVTDNEDTNGNSSTKGTEKYGKKNNDDITDPEKDDGKGKSNKKSKN